MTTITTPRSGSYPPLGPSSSSFNVPLVNRAPSSAEIENRAGVRADVASIILSSAKGGREGGGENDFFKGREREWQENLDDWAGGAVRAAAAVVTFTRSKERGTRGPPRDEDFLRKSR